MTSAPDGSQTIARGYRDAASDRAYRYEQVRRPDGYTVVTFVYTAGSYSSVYAADSAGSFRYLNSDGYERSNLRQ